MRALRHAGLFFQHPVLLERLEKSDSYSLTQYVADTQRYCSIATSVEAWGGVRQAKCKRTTRPPTR